MTPAIQLRSSVQSRPANRFWSLAAFALLMIGGLALTRLLYEGRFPQWLWLGRPLPALLPALALAILIGVGGRQAWGTPTGSLALLPLASNLAYLAQPGVDLTFSRALFGGSLWLVAVLLIWRAVPNSADVRWRWLGPLLIVAALLPVYLFTMSRAVGEADTFEFQVVAPQLGIAHPTGYPLYLMLGKLFSLLPVSTVAWRINLASATYATLAAIVIFWLVRRLVLRPLAALVAALAWGLAPVVWGQAIVAEVYTLHALIVAVALLLMVMMVTPARSVSIAPRMLGLALAFTIGLGLTNHLTTVFLIPPALLVGLYGVLDGRRARGTWPPVDWPYLLVLMAAFLIPLLLYAYLPLRWQAVNGEAMGLGRFVDWVAGGRFQGALQWSAWLHDPARYEIVSRLIDDNWGWFYLVWAAVGFVFLWLTQRRAVLLLLVAMAGFTFYALNYYVPDLAVFLLPTHVIIAVWVGAGAAAGMDWLMRVLSNARIPAETIAGLVFLLLALPLMWRTAGAWASLDQSGRDGGETWARGVLSRSLATDGAILADSEKIAPLYYLQQSEGLRPDLDIMVLPDEATYRSELDRRTAAGQAVYLARFLPGLAGAYHLRSAGPLVQADPQPVMMIPEGAVPTDAVFGPIRLKGYAVEPVVAGDPAQAGITLYWTQERPLADGEELPVIFLRWSSDLYALGPQPIVGQHAASDTYPINAWRPGEIVADYHALPVPVFDCPNPSPGCVLDVWAAWGPRFAGADELVWTPVASMAVEPPVGPVNGRTLRSQIGQWLLDGVEYPAQIRPQTAFTVTLSGWGEGAPPRLRLPAGDATPGRHETDALPVPPPVEGPSQQSVVRVEGVTEPGTYYLLAESPPDSLARCGWLAATTTGCVLGEIEVSGAVVPEGATNFADQIALLDVSLPQTMLQPGGRLPLEITWQGLTPMTENYTVFVQVLDAQDTIVGQVDSWPVQGTFPTSQWVPGRAVRDPYVLQLSSDLSPGDYRLNVGLYLLADLQRLPVVNASGAAVDDKLEIGGLAVSP